MIDLTPLREGDGVWLEQEDTDGNDAFEYAAVLGYFPDGSLRDWVVRDPQFLVERIGEVICDPALHKATYLRCLDDCCYHPDIAY